MESLICLEKKKLDMGNASNGFHSYGQQRFPESLCLSVMKLAESEEIERIIPKKLTCGVDFSQNSIIPNFKGSRRCNPDVKLGKKKGNGFGNMLVFSVAWFGQYCSHIWDHGSSKSFFFFF